MVTAHINNERCEKALTLYYRMQKKGFIPNHKNQISGIKTVAPDPMWNLANTSRIPDWNWFYFAYLDAS